MEGKNRQGKEKRKAQGQRAGLHKLPAIQNWVKKDKELDL